MADPSTREPHKNPIKRLMETTWQVTRPLAETLAETPEGARICDVGAGGRRVRPDAVGASSRAISWAAIRACGR